MEPTENYKNIPKLDPSSDRYRICPYCGEGHLVPHLSQDYCCPDHATRHYNEKRRLNKQAETIINAEKLNKAIVVEKKDNGMAIITKPPLSPEEEKKIGIEKNVSIFNQLPIDDENGTDFKITQLEAIGVNFRNYSSLHKNENVANGYTSNFLLIKNYKICRIEKDIVKIEKTINLKNK